MSMHTEGPYVISTLTDADDMEADLFEEGTIGIYAKSDLDNADECPAALCYLNSNWGEFRDNAKLFAASDVLLSALEKTLSAYIGASQDVMRLDGEKDEAKLRTVMDDDYIVLMARAAISKATA